MTRAFDFVKERVMYFKLDLCCWIAPVKAGLLIIAYINLILATVTLASLSEESEWPLLMQVSTALMPDTTRRPIPTLAYATEFAFTVVLLCGFYRKDIKLMRIYYFYCIAAAVMSFMVYSMVVATVRTVVGIFMIIGIVFQLYVILLVRSVIVVFRLEKKNLELPTLVMSAIPDPQETKVNVDVEATSVSDENKTEEQKDDKKDKLETVDENPKEESSTEEDNKEKK